MINIVPYQPTWVIEFGQLSDQLQRALGPLALRIDHIGSTSVPGLAAKDVIDVQVSVVDFTADISSALQGIRLIKHEVHTSDHVPPGHCPEAHEWEKLVFTRPPTQRRVHIHVRRAGALNQRYPLLFRDYLRAKPHVAQAYGELKHCLASSLAESSNYSDVKDPAVDLIYFAAEDWAASTGWSVN